MTGRYFDGNAIAAIDATLMLSADALELVSAQGATRHARHAVLVSPRVGASERFLVFPDGGQFQCPDTLLLDGLPQEVAGENVVSWLEARWPVALLALVITVVVIALGYRVGLPRLAESLAPRVPIEAEHRIGVNALAWLDENGVFRPSSAAPETQVHIRERLGQLVNGRPVARHIHVEFREMGDVANALALPGGTIVVTDGMIRAAESYEELMAVLAHEVGHVERRHALRLLIEGSAVTLAIAAVIGDAGATTVGTTLIPTILLQAGYRRELETEADAFAFDLLSKNRLSPALFADLMDRIDPGTGATHSLSQFLSTHPGTAERVHAARQAARP